MINKNPYIEIPCDKTSCWEGWEDIGTMLKARISEIPKKKIIITIESNLGTHITPNIQALKDAFSPNVTCRARNIFKTPEQISKLTNRKSNGTTSLTNPSFTIEDYFDTQKLDGLRKNIDFIEAGVILIYGIGAYKICEPDILIYSDISRWEQDQRFRRGEIENIGLDNLHDPYRAKSNWFHFVERKICDKIKRSVIHDCDFFLETNNWKKPKIATGDIIRTAYESTYSQPFFNAPFFDPELWDGEKKESNNPDDFSWGFDCNLDRNNVLFKFEDILFESPAINLIFHDPKKILGNNIFRKYGLDFPIRHNFIDTLDSEDLNLYTFPASDRVRDIDEYHQHSECYYVMESGPQSGLSLGLKPGISTEYFKQVALDANTKKLRRELKKLLNRIDMKKHDHLIIPDQTLHDKGIKLMMLAISTTSSIHEIPLFPENEEPIEIHRCMDSVSNLTPSKEELFNCEQSMDFYGISAELLGSSDQSEFELIRFYVDKPLKISGESMISVLNMIDGPEAKITGQFNPFTVHYSETFVIPASVDNFTIEPVNGRVGFLINRSKLG
ncbi:MAG: hypothetical protein KI791_20465 [Cyclobacteriaceae bacterium]|nr:hypothetical protein [Cyclobacteriaceae bacterium SS2]